MENTWVNYISKNKYASAAAKAAVVSLSASLLYYAFKEPEEDKWNPKGFTKIPGPSGYPLIGQMISMGFTPSFQIEKWHEKYGPIIHFNFGAQQWVIINDPVLAHELFVRNATKASDRRRHKFTNGMYSKGGRGIAFSQPGKKLKHTRSIAISILSPKYVDRYLGVLGSIAEGTVRLMKEASDKDGSVFPMPFIQMATFSAMIKSIFARPLRLEGDPVVKEIIHIMESELKFAGPAGDLGSFFPRIAWANSLFQKKKQMEALVARRDELYKMMISEALSGDEDCLVKQAYSMKEEYGLEDNDLLVMMSDMTSAGGDTTAISLSWLFAVLPHHPDVQKKICEEIDRFYTKFNRLPTFSDREEFPFMCAVLRENIRFRSVTTFGIPHFTSEDIELREYFIPKGTVVACSMYAMHMNPDVYYDPKKFIPERFLGHTKSWSASANGPIDERDMYSFGWGRRICPGIYFAEVEEFNLCISTLSRYTVEPALDSDGYPVYPDLKQASSTTVVFAPAEYKVRLVTREDSPLNK
ncbi:cytochrome P450 [Phycomyces nitens]|nr:cytochrome P450 [Phycomyces nitens]